MDDPHLDRSEHRRALDGLRRVNLLSNTASTIARQIVSISEGMRLETTSVLDLGCGSGDVALGVAKRLPRTATWHVEGWDMSQTAIAYAEERCNQMTLDKKHAERDSRTNLVFREQNVFDKDSRVFDIVYCSLFLHHFDEPTAIRVLKRMHELARIAIIVDDLDRSLFGLLLAKVGVRVLSRSPIVHFDGPQSVRAAFTVDEIAGIAAKAGLHGVEIQKRWPARWLMTAGRVAHAHSSLIEQLPAWQELPSIAQQRHDPSLARNHGHALSVEDANIRCVTSPIPELS